MPDAKTARRPQLCASVEAELDRILQSPGFRTSKRSQELPQVGKSTWDGLRFFGGYIRRRRRFCDPIQRKCFAHLWDSKGSAFVIDENLEVSHKSAEFPNYPVAAAAADRRVVTSPSFPRVLGPYSHAVVAGGFVFVAGQAPINPSTQEFELGDIESETRLELTNMSAILEAAGSNLASVVKVSIHLSSLDDFDGMNRAYVESFRSDYPVRTTTQAVLRSGRKIEIDCIARLKD
jgi:2-iminobutanoate/2-iminopropanoate deaminase